MQTSGIKELQLNEIEQVNGGRGTPGRWGRILSGLSAAYEVGRAALNSPGSFGDNNNGIGPKF